METKVCKQPTSLPDSSIYASSSSPLKLPTSATHKRPLQKNPKIIIGTSTSRISHFSDCKQHLPPILHSPNAPFSESHIKQKTPHFALYRKNGVFYCFFNDQISEIPKYQSLFHTFNNAKSQFQSTFSRCRFRCRFFEVNSEVLQFRTELFSLHRLSQNQGQRKRNFFRLKCYEVLSLWRSSSLCRKCKPYPPPRKNAVLMPYFAKSWHRKYFYTTTKSIHKNKTL